ncbi:hypothetical protein WJX79_007102 [Trebouxia sp. C0005]
MLVSVRLTCLRRRHLWFTTVTCSYGFMFMPDLDKALQEANRILQPGGLLVATVWAEVEKCHNMQAFQGLAKALMGPKFSFTTPWPITDPHELQQHIQAANFEKAAGNNDIYQQAAQALKDVCATHGWLQRGAGVVHLNNTALLFTAVKT